MFKEPPEFKSFDDVRNYFQEIHDNLSLSNIQPSDIRTTTPALTEVEPGKIAHAEISGVPTIFQRSLDGNTLYKFTGIAI